MKARWVTKRLGEVAKTQYGLSERMNEEAKGFRIFRMGEVQAGRLIDTGRMKYADISRQEFEQYKLQTGDLLFNRTNSFELVGKTGIFALDGDYCFASYLVRLNLDRKKVLPAYLNYFINSDGFQKSVKEKASKSINQANINATILSNEPIHFPESLPEQQRIVGMLDDAFESIATARTNAERNLQNARAIFESHLNVVFSEPGPDWNRLPIHKACDSIMDCVNKTAPKADGPTKFKMIRTSNVRAGRLNLESVNYVTEDVYRIWTRRQVPRRGDVILTREAPMGEVGMLLSDENVFLGQRLVSYRADPTKLNSRFLLYALQSSDLQCQIRSLASGSTVQHMRVPDTKKLQLPLPSLKEQETAAATLDKIREETECLSKVYRAKLAALDALKRSLLHQAFTGKL